MPSLYDFSVPDIDGSERPLSEWKDKVVLVVNVASKCGLTPQYDGLQRLYDEYRGQGVEILGFPCNQFMQQEPGSEAEIKEFCTLEYGVTFPLFSKVEVNGDGCDPLYAWLTASEVGPEEAGDVKWNFGKFLIGRDGQIRARFAPQTEPCSDEVVQAITAALAH
ncbi:MAG: glutathione peroxidase [Deltaproteobacteria bacterium]|jgi:glutathione peroxidase|nr:glutathione peroxidase [Deltaproteobacteria bacterium]MBW2383754.1 glutathione peroxidase [Deltaproteobacteria bacterium]MBW2699012.1 glutathione peroxidase [Deltaproteobacteria bacterium]